MAACVYRFFTADGELLYVGCTKNLPQRLGQHAPEQPWWSEVASMTVEHFDDLGVAIKAETRAIRAEGARYNILPDARARKAWVTRSRGKAARALNERLIAIALDPGQPAA